MMSHSQPSTDQTNYDPNHPGKVYSEGLVAPVDIPMMGHLHEDHRPLQLFTKHWGD